MTPKEFKNYLDDRVNQLMMRNRYLKYVPRKKGFWERLRNIFRKQQIKSVKK